jgi:hypothetical protein
MIPSELPNQSFGLTYRDRLHPWCIIYLLPNMQRTVVARCRSRSNAEEHLKVLNRIVSNHTYTIVFDPSHD